jgi:hypothetical protein
MIANSAVGSDRSYRGQLGEGTEGLRGRGQGGVVASRGRVRGGCGAKVVVSQRALTPSFWPVNALVNLIAVNQMDPYDSDSSDRGSEFPSQSTIPENPLSTILIMRRTGMAFGG